MTFEALHQAIAERDTHVLSDICEQNLRYSFGDLFENLDEEDCTIEIKNKSEISPTISSIDIIDY